MVGLGLLDGLKRGAQIGPRIEGDLAEIVERLERVGKVEWAGHVELLDRGAVVEQLQELDLGGAQVDDGRLNLDSYCTRSSSMRSRSIWAMSPALKSIAADLDDVVVVVEVGLGQFEDSLCLQGLHKLRTKIEVQIALQVLVLRRGDLRAFFGALKSKLALVVALVQIADAGYELSAGQRHPVRA